MEKLYKELKAIITQNISRESTLVDVESIMAKIKNAVLVKVGIATAAGGTATGFIVGYWDKIIAFFG